MNWFPDAETTMAPTPSPEVYQALVEHQRTGAEGWALEEVIRYPPPVGRDLPRPV